MAETVTSRRQKSKRFAAPTDTWFITDDGKLWRSTGGAPATQSAPSSELYDLAGIGPNDVWIAARSSIQKYDGTSWSAMTDPSLIAYQVWGTARNDVWAAGAFGHVAHWNGSTWTDRDGQRGDVREITGTSASDVWMLEGVVERWSGTSWVETPVPAASGSFTDLAVTATELWATGNGGGILRKLR
jgi:hypothetical protein